MLDHGARGPRAPLGVSPVWMQVAILTFVVGFAILGYLAYRVYGEQPPIPGATIAWHANAGLGVAVFPNVLNDAVKPLRDARSDRIRWS